MWIPSEASSLYSLADLCNFYLFFFLISAYLAGSVFMCRLCNLFSPSRSQLLAHCTQNHPEHESPDSIIATLAPLKTVPVEELQGKSTMVLHLQVF